MNVSTAISRVSAGIVGAIVITCTVLSLSFAQSSATKTEVGSKIRIRDVEVTVLYDSYPSGADLELAWGFSCIIRGAEKTILFDTGGTGPILLRNMRQLGVTPEEVDIVVLSHAHRDHVGGLPALLAKNSDVSVFMPESFPSHISEEAERRGAKVVQVGPSLKICEQVYSTGEMGDSEKEQAVVINTERGGVVITGCAHPGIVRISRRAKALVSGDLLLVLGGFHLKSASTSKVETVIKGLRDLGVLYVGTCHCTGSVARRLFRRAFQSKHLDLGAGSVVTLRHLPFE